MLAEASRDQQRIFMGTRQRYVARSRLQTWPGQRTSEQGEIEVGCETYTERLSHPFHVQRNRCLGKSSPCRNARTCSGSIGHRPTVAENESPQGAYTIYGKFIHSQSAWNDISWKGSCFGHCINFKHEEKVLGSCNLITFPI